MFRIAQEELQHRQDQVREELEKRNLQGACLFGKTTIFYLTGFAFIPTERPMALVMNKNESVLLLPELEKSHAEKTGVIDRAVSYPEYPSFNHPMETLKELLLEMGLEKANIGVDAGGYPALYGYKGPTLKDLIPEASQESIGSLFVEMRIIKSEQEIALIKESARWGNLAHALLQEYSGAGVSEIEASMRASMEATRTMMKTLGKAYNPMGGRGASAGYRGQVGANSALPHAVTINAIMHEGDTLVTGAGAGIGGYNSELERTMFVGEPNEEQRRLFNLMVEAQDLAFEAIKPGEPCSVVDKVVRDFFEKHDLWQYWRHHQGHAIGLEIHEAPFFDVGDDSIMKPGMVMCVEPGLYAPGLGGFRHSDTVVVTDKGMEMITYYPRDLESLIVK